MLKSAILTCLGLFPCFASSSLNDMNLEEKVGQLLMVHFNGEVANNDAKTLIQNVFVGGIIYYNWANGLRSPEQVRALSANLQGLAKTPLFIAVDQEGGPVSRLKEGFTVFPANKTLGMTGNPELAELAAFAIGQELLAVGVNMNLAPVVDVNSNPKNPVIGIRSFGNSPEIVISFASRALEGYHRAGILSSLKHFPGHGDVEIDSHEDLPIIHKSKEQLEAIELLPFIQLASQADTVMTAHIMVPSLDPKNCATLSKKILDILRKEIGFEGLILSDSLIMEGVLKNCHFSVEEAAIRAFNAGCDVLILGGKQLIGTRLGFELTVADIQRVHRALVAAVQNGCISEERLNESVQRILDVKNRYPIANPEKKDFTR